MENKRYAKSMTSLKFNNEVKLGKNGLKLIEFYKEYMKNRENEMISQAIVLSVKDKFGFVESFDKFKSENEFKEYLLTVNKFVATKEEIIDYAADFAQTIIDFESLELSYKANIKDNVLILYHMIGIKRSMIPDIFEINNENDTYNLMENFIPTFIDKFIRKKIKDYLQKVEVKGVNIQLSDITYSQNRFHDIYMEFHIPINKLNSKKLKEIEKILINQPNYF